MEMTLSKAIALFLENPTKYGDIKRKDHKGMYLKKIKVFEQYCATKYSDTYNNNLWINTIEKFDLRDIKDSMIFYVTESAKSKKVAKASILRDYLMILVEFFRFLDKTLQITNTNILVMVGSNDTIHPNLIEIIEEISSTYSLSMKRDQSPVISKDDAKKLVEQCNKEINRSLTKNPYLWDSKWNKYNTLVARLATKLILYTGLSCDRLTDIKIEKETDSDILLSEPYNVIEISGYDLDLPRDLSAQLCQYIKLRQIISDCTKTKNTCFFYLLRATQNLATNY